MKKRNYRAIGQQLHLIVFVNKDNKNKLLTDHSMVQFFLIILKSPKMSDLFSSATLTNFFWLPGSG